MTTLYDPERGLKSQLNPDWEQNLLKDYNSITRASEKNLNGKKLDVYVFCQ